MPYKRVLWILEESEHKTLNEERKAKNQTWNEFLDEKTGVRNAKPRV